MYMATLTTTTKAKRQPKRVITLLLIHMVHKRTLAQAQTLQAEEMTKASIGQKVPAPMLKLFGQ